MATKSTFEDSHAARRKPQLFRLGLAALLALIVAFGLFGGAWANQTNRANVTSNWNDVDSVLNPSSAVRTRESVAHSQSPTSTPEQSSRSETLPPVDFMQQTTAPPASQGTQVYIDFDTVPTGTTIYNQYSPAVFTTDQYHYVFANSQYYYGSSRPNVLDRGPFFDPSSGFAPLYVHFTTPVNDLKFYVVAVDEYRQGIAQVNVYQNNQTQPTGTIRVDGYGVFNIPLINVGATYNNVTRIDIVNQTDYRGLVFDDFSFTHSSASPTPTPSASPQPFPPTNLTAHADFETIQLNWSDSPSNATSYTVKRRTSGGPWTIIAQNIPPQAFTVLGVSTVRGVYKDNDVNPNTVYEYSVHGVSSSGVSVESAIASANLIPSCGNYVRPRPGPQYYPDPGHGWALNGNVSDKDGLVLSDVSLNGRYMAKMMSVPYFFVKTSKMTTRQRGELTPDSEALTIRARLKHFWTSHPFDTTNAGSYGSRYIAEYAVDRLTPTSKSCLYITQEYIFQKHNPNENCEPSGRIPCSRFYPKVSYRFVGRAGELLESVNIPVRLHYQVDGALKNTIGLFRDTDTWNESIAGLSPFRDVKNPLTAETDSLVVDNGFPNAFDNIHQTNGDVVTHPEDLLHSHSGCPECVHNHWRWGAFYQGRPFRFPQGHGFPIIGINPNIFTPTNQDLYIGLVRYKAGEEHPSWDYSSLIEKNPTESIRDWVIRVPPTGTQGPRLRVLGPAEVVFWYSGTSYEPKADLFFKHGSFFNPRLHEHVMTMNEASAGSSPETHEDGVRSITYGNIYNEGTTAFTHVELTSLAPLPSGYVALDNRAHRVATEAIVSGPHVVSFNVPSVTDQSTFNDLAVFHLEQDPFDPDSLIWVDTKILSPDPAAPDFTNRIVSARVNDVGYFVIGRLVQPRPDLGSSDLSVTVVDSPDPVVVENNLTYVLHVANAGPRDATGVGLIDVIPPEAVFVSSTPGQGTCKFKDGIVFCKLGTLTSGGSCDVTIVVNLREDRTGVPSQGRLVDSTAVVAADNDDLQLDNNSTTQSTTLLPSANAKPSVTISSPATGTTYVGPQNVSITATASDSDGTIARVDIYEGATLIGTAAPSGTNQYQLALALSFGPHTFTAVATDNGGRTNVSGSVNLFVNGTATVNITSPTAGAVLDPTSNLTITASATDSSGPITKVEFFANSISLGEGVPNGNQYSVTWNDLVPGSYVLAAISTDSSGIATHSLPVNVTVTTRPTVTILSPTDGTSYPVLSRVGILAKAQDTDGFISKVDFYASGSLIGTGSTIGQDQFTVDWMQVPTGVYLLTAVATDNLGVSATSPAITIGVNTQTPRPGEFVWFDDALPSGAIVPTTNDEGWHWVNLNPAPFSGTVAHQSRTLGQAEPPNSFHQHSFEGATFTLPVNAGDVLFVDVFLDPDDMPREIMLQWKAADGWEHRAYWGENRIDLGTNNTNGRRRWGSLPPPGQWVRLGIPASHVGLEGATLNGMAFSLDGGRATFDIAGKMTANAAPPPTSPPGDFVWMEDDLPPGAVISYIDDGWNWDIGTVYSGQRAHQTQSLNGKQLRQHAFTGALTPMQVNLGDVLFTYVYLGDPNLSHQPNTPDQIMLQWYDGASWSHRAFWGSNRIGQILPNMGRLDTEQHRYMGGLPAARGWYRLEVPASYVGLEGKTVSGMAFSAYRGGNNPLVTWDRSGKSPALTTAPLPLSARTSIWRYHNGANGWAYQQGEQPPATYAEQKRHAFYALPNKAAGAVELHRFVKGSSQPFYYYYGTSTTKSGWTYENVAFYVFSPAAPAPPGTVPLHRYYDSQGRYFLTIDQNDIAAGMNFYDGIAGYVYTEPVPAAPTFHPSIYESICPKTLTWRDNSGNETGFKFEHSENITWVTDAVLERDRTSFAPTPCKTNVRSYRVRAYNSGGISLPSGACTGCATSVDPSPPNTAPTVSIAAPANGDLVGHNFLITANAFDLEGNGTIVKVEFFANGSKIGEVPYAPHNFVWNNAPPGTHSLTAVATDSAGASTTSSPVNVTVDQGTQTITFDVIPDKTYGDAAFALNASASSYLPVSFSVVSGPATLSGNTLTITGAGTVTVRASQPGDANYNAAADVDRTFNVAKAAAEITLSNLNQTYDGSPKTVTATTNPGNLTGISITYNGSATAPANAGSYPVVASLSNANYQAADATGTLTIAKASQTITFNAPANKTYGDAPFALSATSSSNLAVTFSVVSGPATISGSTVTINGAGTVTVRASQSGDANYNAASNLDRSFTVAKGLATIALTNLDQTYNGTSRPATATTNPAGLSAVSITYNGSTTAPTNAGSYAVVASLSNANYQAADATGTLTIAKASQTITFSAPANKTYGDAPFALSATSSSNLAVTFSVASGPATISGSTVTITGAGTVTVRASQSGDGQYNAAIDVDRIFDVAKATATMTLTNLNQIYDGIPKPVTVTTVPEGLAGVVVVYGDYGNTAPADAGSYYVQAFLSNNNYTANDVTRTLVIAKASQTITFTALPSKTYGDAPFALTASSTSGLAVGFSIASGPATISGNMLTITGAGTVVVRASQSGNFNYNPATDVNRTFTVAQATATLSLSNLNQTYDGAPKAVTVTTTPPGLTGVTAYYNGFSTPPTSAGSYSVVATLTNNNYRADNVAGTLTIAGSANSYSYRRSVTIDHTKVANTGQMNFPLLISGTYSYLATVANGGNVQNANGYDVVFGLDSGCSMRLNHEVESYNALTGAVNYWVRVPTLSHTSDTVIYMCYGNPTISTSQENAVGVWDANFKAIYHLKNGTSLDVTDSTTLHPLTNNGATATTGQVDGGSSFDGSTKYLSSIQHVDFNWSSLRTVEFWMKLGTTSQTLPRLFSQSNGSNTAWSISWVDTASVEGYGLAGKYLVISIGVMGRTGTPVLKRTPDGGISSTSSWYHIAVVGDGTTVVAIYVNGMPVTLANNVSNVANSAISSLNIGRRNSNYSYFNGSLDEIRFSNVQRSAGWIKTQYNNQISPSAFYTISSASGGSAAAMHWLIEQLGFSRDGAPQAVILDSETRSGFNYDTNGTNGYTGEIDYLYFRLKP